MSVIGTIRRLTCILAGLAAALVACTAAAPAALAVRVPPPGGRAVRPPVHTVMVGGMPGWQIALIAVGAALLAAVLAVLFDRAWAARQHRAVPSA